MIFIAMGWPNHRCRLPGLVLLFALGDSTGQPTSSSGGRSCTGRGPPGCRRHTGWGTRLCVVTTDAHRAVGWAGYRSHAMCCTLRGCLTHSSRG